MVGVPHITECRLSRIDLWVRSISFFFGKKCHVVSLAKLDHFFDFLGLSPAELKEIYGPDGLAGGAGSIEDFLVQISFGVVLYFSVAAIGYWRGRRNRQCSNRRDRLRIEHRNPDTSRIC